MKIYKKYLIKNLFKPLIISLVTLTLILWSSRIIKYLYLIAEDGAEFASFFNLTLLILPALIIMILPLTIFLTSILTYNKLIENREIIILKNCGIKKIQLLTPLLILSVIITLLSYGFSLYGTYKANLGIRNIKYKIQNNASFTIIKDGVFSSFKNFIVYADKKEENKAFNLLIYSKAQKENEKDMLLQAENAIINGDIITLRNGTFQRSSNNYQDIPEILFFKEYNLKFSEFRQEDEEKTIKPDSMSTLKLFKILKNYREFKNIFPDKNKIIYEINYRLSFPLLSIIMALLSGSLMLEGTFNRISNSKIVVKTSAISVTIYILLLSLYQKVESGTIYLFVLYLVMTATIVFSLNLIKEKKNTAIPFT